VISVLVMMFMMMSWFHLLIQCKGIAFSSGLGRLLEHMSNYGWKHFLLPPKTVFGLR